MTIQAGFIGLGIIGRPMALNLIKGGYQRLLYSRRRESMIRPLQTASSAMWGTSTDPPSFITRRNKGVSRSSRRRHCRRQSPSGTPLSRRSFRRVNTTWPRSTSSNITRRTPCVISATKRDADATRGSRSSGGMPWDTERFFPLLKLHWTCDNSSCRMLFLDKYTANRHRWCAMSICGNRAKVTLHRQRKKGSR